jgi:flavin-dependent dehydrogenase
VEKHEVVIVGAGPAGLKAGELLAKANKDVLIIEKEKEENIGDKPCNGMLSPLTIKLFEVPKELIERYMNGFVFYLQGGSYITTELKPPLVGMCNRKRFQQWLLKKSEKIGVEVRDNTKIISIDRCENYVITENGNKIGYNFLIGADGSRSVVRKGLGLKSETCLATYTEVDVPSKEIIGYEDYGCWYFDFNICGNGYCGFTPYKDKVGYCLVSMNNDFFSTSQKVKNFYKFAKEVHGIDLSKYELKAATVCYKYVGLKHDNIYLTGDAGGFGSIMAGEIYLAAKSGELAAREILGEKIDKSFKDLMAFKKKENILAPILTLVSFIHPQSLRKKLTMEVYNKIVPRVLSNNQIFNASYRFIYRTIFEKKVLGE